MQLLPIQEQKYGNANRMRRHVIDNDWYETGNIATAFGFVSAYRENKFYLISFIWDGIEYRHSRRESISMAALVRRASLLARTGITAFGR